MKPFHCTVRKSDGSVVVSAGGDVDLVTHDRLVETVRPQLGGADVVLDCAGITFLDSYGLHALLLLREEAIVRNSGFVLSAVSDPVKRVLDLTGTTGCFTVRTGLAGAAAADGEGGAGPGLGAESSA